LELWLLSFSTGQAHPLAEQPIIFIDKKILPLDWRNCKIEIVEDFIILLVTFPEWNMNEDIFFLVCWKTGLTHCVSVWGLLQIRAPSFILYVQLASPEKGTHDSFTHLSQDTLVVPNLIQNTFEITKIVIDNYDTPHFVLLCVLHLPPLNQNTSPTRIWCRADPNPTGSGHLIPSRSDRPFRDKAEDAIVIFNMSYDPYIGIQMDRPTLIVHRRALLAHIPTVHRACAPFCSTPEPAPALVEVPWPVWGPPVTRLFVGNPTPMYYTATTAGQRAVMLDRRRSTQIIVRDFNPYAVRAARAMASESGQSQEGNWSTLLPNGNRMSLKVEDSVLTAGSIFKEDVGSSLPYVEIMTQDKYQYDGVMMDDERILGFQVRFEYLSLNGVLTFDHLQTGQDGHFTSFFDVHVLG
jgi:hypothetical protein